MFPDFVQNHCRKVPEAREHLYCPKPGHLQKEQWNLFLHSKWSQIGWGTHLWASGWRLKPEGVRSTLSYAKLYSELILVARWCSYEILQNCNFLTCHRWPPNFLHRNQLNLSFCVYIVMFRFSTRFYIQFWWPDDAYMKILKIFIFDVMLLTKIGPDLPAQATVRLEIKTASRSILYLSVPKSRDWDSTSLMDNIRG